MRRPKPSPADTPSSKLTAVLLLAAALTLGGCGAESLLAGGIAGSGAVDTGEAGAGQVEKTRDQLAESGQLPENSEGEGRVPAPTHSCPDDADALEKLMETTPYAALDDGEQTAVKTLYRAASSCPSSDVISEYQEWSD